jgi:hypothetical protein
MYEKMRKKNEKRQAKEAKEQARQQEAEARRRQKEEDRQAKETEKQRRQGEATPKQPEAAATSTKTETEAIEEEPTLPSGGTEDSLILLEDDSASIPQPEAGDKAEEEIAAVESTVPEAPPKRSAPSKPEEAQEHLTAPALNNLPILGDTKYNPYLMRLRNERSQPTPAPRKEK